MNDLNSVFLVGRVKSVKRTPDGLRMVIVNNHYSFNEEKKEYEEQCVDFTVSLFGRTGEKFSASIGNRIGVNGRLTGDGIVGYSVQQLEKAAPGEKAKRGKK